MSSREKKKNGEVGSEDDIDIYEELVNLLHPCPPN